MVKGKCTVCTVLALAVAGCSATTGVRVGSGVPLNPAPGSAVSAARVSIDIRSGSAVGVIAAAAALGALFTLDRRDAGAPSLSGLLPEMAPGREVNAQDCTRPIERPAANLLCR